MRTLSVPAETIVLNGHPVTITLTHASKRLYAAACRACGNEFISGFPYDFVRHRADYHAGMCACAPRLAPASLPVAA
jgi:hypothetical protein